MPKKLRILLVHHQEEPWDGLTPLLEWQGITTFRARNCAEAERALGSSESHLLVLTEPVLPDGTWAEILALARRMPSPVPVVVVSRYMDVDLYLDVLEKGAWDFYRASLPRRRPGVRGEWRDPEYSPIQTGQPGGRNGC